MDVVSVGGAGIVSGLHGSQDSSGDSLLSAIEMDKSKHLASVVHLGTPVMDLEGGEVRGG